MKVIIDYSKAAERKFRKLEYGNEELLKWCIREAFSTPWLTTEREFVLFAVSLYEAQIWADSLLESDRKKEKENELPDDFFDKTGHKRFVKRVKQELIIED